MVAEAKRQSPMDLLNVFVREQRNLSSEWEIYRWERGYESHKDLPPDYMRVTGAVAPLKDDGTRDWRKEKKSTCVTIWISDSDYREWLKNWSEKTGKCHVCVGEKTVLKSWSRDEGTTYVPCPDCLGSGRSTPAPTGGEK
jgi:hypothetical protein